MSNLKSFIENRLRDYNPSIDLSDNSPVQNRVVTPIVELLESDVLDTDSREFLISKLQELFPSISALEGDGIVDLLINPAQLYFEVYRRELERIRVAQSIANVDSISDEDAEALAANWLVTRDEGSFSTGTVRVFYNSPRGVTLDRTIRFFTRDNVEFFPIQNTSISAGQMLNNVVDGPRYYVDVACRSVEVGSQANIPTNSIVTVTGLAAVQSVTNLNPFTGGADADTIADLINFKIPTAISERSLVTARGVNARIQDVFSSIAASRVIGFGDPEMNRDVIYAASSGPTKGFGVSVLMGRFAFIMLYTEEEAPVVGDRVTLTYPEKLFPAASPREETLEITQIFGRASSIAFLPNATTHLLVALEKEPAYDTIDAAIVPSLPEGLFPAFARVHGKATVTVNVNQVEEVLPDGGVHLGGHTDVYVNPISDVARSTPVFGASTFMVSGRQLATTLGTNEVSLYGDPADLAVIQPGHVLHIESGADAGFYYIARVRHDPTTFVDYATVRLLSDLTATKVRADNVHWGVIDKIRVDAFNPRKVLMPITDTTLEVDLTIGQAVAVANSSPVDFGVQAGDTLVFTYRDVEYEYNITALSGLNITLGAIMPFSAANLSAQIVRKYSGLARPLSRMDSMALSRNDAQIPYGKPVGMEVVYLGGARENGSGLVGFVGPFIPNFLPVDGSGDPTDLAVARATINSSEQPFSSNNLFTDAFGHFYTIHTESVSGSEMLQEFDLPEEMFDGKNNIFITTGNIQYQDIEEWVNTYYGYLDSSGVFVAPTDTLPDNWRTDPDYYPLAKNSLKAPITADQGDILTIVSGANQGSYPIRKVHQTGINLGEAGTRNRWMPISIVVIEGEFPEDPLRPLFTAMGELTQVNGNEGFSLGDSLRMFLAPHILADSADFLDAVNDTTAVIKNNLGLSVQVLAGTLNLDPEYVYSILGEYLYSRYSFGRPARGVGRLYFKDPVTTELETYHIPAISQTFLESPADPKFKPVYDLFYATTSSGIDLIPALHEVAHYFVAPEGFDATNPTTWSRDLSSDGGFDLYVESAPIDLGISKYGRDTMLVLAERRFCPAPASVNFTGLVYEYTEQVSGRHLYKTTQNSPVVEVIQMTEIDEGNFPFSTEDIGNFLFLDGDDGGGYEITAIDRTNWRLTLDTPMTSSTLAPLAKGVGVVNAADTAILAVTYPSPDVLTRTPLAEDVGRYVTLYNVVEANYKEHVGSYEILGVTDLGGGSYDIEFDNSIDWATLLGGVWASVDVAFIITEAPENPPSENTDGTTELIAGASGRLYDQEPDEVLIENIDSDAGAFGVNIRDLDGAAVTIDAESNDRNPYTILRRGFLRTTSDEMTNFSDGAFYYIDLPIQSLSHSPDANLQQGETAKPFNVYCEGYYLESLEKDLTFSTREDSQLVVSPYLFTSGSTDLRSTTTNLVEESLLASYKVTPVVGQLQAILSNSVDRVMAANILAKRMLPGVVGVYLEYEDGESEATVEAAIRRYITSIATGFKPLDVSDFISIVYNNASRYVRTPIQLYVLVVDQNRDHHLLKISDSMTSLDDSIFEGTSRITGFIPGDDDEIIAVKISRGSRIGNG